VRKEELSRAEEGEMGKITSSSFYWWAGQTGVGLAVERQC